MSRVIAVRSLLALGVALTIGFAISCPAGRADPVDPIELANGYLEQGHDALSVNNIDIAASAFSLALQAFRVSNDRRGEAQALRGLGIALVASGHVEDGILRFEESLEIARIIDDCGLEACCYIELGHAYMQLDDPTTALHYFEAAQQGVVASSDREAEAEILRGMGVALSASGRAADAILRFEECLVIARSIDDRKFEARCCMDLAYVLQSVSRCAQALDYAEQAETLYRISGDQHGETWALLLCSNCHLDLAQYDHALDHGTSALGRFRELGDARGEAEALVCLSSAHEILGEFQQAIDYCMQALSIFREVDQSNDVASALMRLGAYYQQVGETGLAEEAWQQSLDLARTLDSSWLLGNALLSVGQSLVAQGDTELAIAKLEEALYVFRAIGDRGGEANCLAPLTDCHMQLGEHERVLEYAEEIIAIGREIGNKRIECNGLMILGDTKRQLEFLEDAVESLEQSLGIAREIEARVMQYGIHWQLARCYRGLGLLDDAKTHCELAIAGVEAVSGDLQAEELRQSYLGSVRQLYVEYLRLMLEMGSLERSYMGDTLLVAERCRARTFLDLVAAGPVGTVDNIAEEGIRTGAVDASVIESDLAEVIAGLRTGTAALEYFVTEEITYVWLVRDGVVGEIIQIEIARSDLLKQVLGLRSAIETSSTGLSGAPDESTLATSRGLHELLIAPIADQLEGIEHLVIVPSGPLYYLPFCALLDCPNCEGAELLGGAYLIERFSLSYAPSLTMLKYAWASADTASTDHLFLGVADPASCDPNLPRLPDAQEEAAKVAELFDPSEVYVGDTATEGVVASRAGAAEHLLLSTHGAFNPFNPMFSYLLLAPTDGSDGRLHTHEVFSLDLRTDLVTLSACETLLPALEETEAQVRAVRGMREEEDVEIDEDLMETLTAGDEIVGLTRAFLYAGTPSVLSSLWRVVSETTEPLMVAFYRYLLQGVGKAQALRQAQLDVMASYPHPRYWAAFELVGDWR